MTEDERPDFRSGKPVLRIQIDPFRQLRHSGLAQAIQQALDVGRVLEHKIPLRDQLVCPSVISFQHDLLQPVPVGRDPVAAPEMRVGRNQHLQAIEFRPWIGRLEIDLFKALDGLLETTLAKISQPGLVVPIVIAAWVNTVGRIEIVARLLRPAIEIQGLCEPDIIPGIARDRAPPP